MVDIKNGKNRWCRRFLHIFFFFFFFSFIFLFFFCFWSTQDRNIFFQRNAYDGANRLASPSNLLQNANQSKVNVRGRLLFRPVLTVSPVSATKINGTMIIDRSHFVFIGEYRNSSVKRDSSVYRRYLVKSFVPNIYINAISIKFRKILRI